VGGKVNTDCLVAGTRLWGGGGASAKTILIQACVKAFKPAAGCLTVKLSQSHKPCQAPSRGVHGYSLKHVTVTVASCSWGSVAIADGTALWY
jgi:hypothetical protein